jgi:hypothetical protein
MAKKTPPSFSGYYWDKTNLSNLLKKAHFVIKNEPFIMFFGRFIKPENRYQKFRYICSHIFC